MKIGIIAEFGDNILNYGNYLQTYALNYYVRTSLKEAQVETIKIQPSLSNILRTKRLPIKVIVQTVWNLIKIKTYGSYNFPEREARKKTFIEFAANNITQSKTKLTYEELAKQDHDIYIVGSDVVWRQHRYEIERVKFLDFQGQKPFKRISYAASFGRDWIPEENKSDIRRCLKEFDAISVREKSSTQLLRSIGIDSTHALDPTLLLSKEEWESLEIKPKEVDSEKYIFTFLLGTDLQQHGEIERICHKEGLKIVTIPFAAGVKNKIDRKFGDVQIWECSPQNWIWLVHHAEYILTDSFHGLVFSTIFHKKFLILERVKNLWGNRLTDFLQIIAQEDKSIQIDKVKSLADFRWDYGMIDRMIAKEKEQSVDFLKKSLEIK